MAVITPFPTRAGGRGIERVPGIRPTLKVVDRLLKGNEVSVRQQRFQGRVRSILDGDPSRLYGVYRSPQYLASGGIWPDYQKLTAPFTARLVRTGGHSRFTTTSLNGTKFELAIDGDHLSVVKKGPTEDPDSENPRLRLIPKNKTEEDILWLAFADELLTYVLQNGVQTILQETQQQKTDLHELQKTFIDWVNVLLDKENHAVFISDIKLVPMQAGSFWPYYKDLEPPIQLSIDRGEQGIEFGLEAKNDGCFAIHVHGNDIDMIVVNPSNAQRPMPVYRDDAEEKIAGMKFANEILALTARTKDIAPEVPPVA